ncbi:class I SAM-dependent methyltransferase [Phenylobacterium sp.]|uniref:class I SAM-dependent methyltransferase n=1 Tax=Phenylobacterium sp. TaxID=1871053 RepID=UPI002734605A|nr:class I SAM-dependent methyltransferase [Phenylobacterium sp.]MDP3853204.1 class I SAM-dependent methyltransferase [Phenylobacterium sp.]
MISNPNAFYDGGLAVETYDLFAAQNGKLAGDVDFYLEMARSQGGPVLELGTGTGRVLAPLAEAGFEVTGVDISQAMLDVAGRRLAAAGLRARLLCTSMQAFETDARFDLALIPARAFQHLVDPADQRACLTRVRDHLNPGGVLVLDLFDPRLETCVGEPDRLPDREVVNPATGGRYRKVCLGRFADPFAQVTGERMRIEALDGHGGVTASQETSWALRWSTRQETAYLLELSGFAIEAQYSDFAKAPPVYGGEQLWVARRA